MLSCPKNWGEALEKLSPKEKTSVKMLYGIGLDQTYDYEEIAEHFRMSPKSVERVVSRARGKLHHILEDSL